MVVATEQLYTLEEFWALPDETTRGCELIDGRIVKKHDWDGEEQGITRDMATHMRVIRLIWRALDSAAEQSGVGAAYTEPTLRTAGAGGRSRRPDIAAIYGELPDDADALRALAPEMAVEVISPNNTAFDLFDKVEEYLAAGVQLVWLAIPTNRVIIAFRRDHTVVFRPGDSVTAEPVLPGFACPVDDLFPPPANPVD